MKVDIKQTKLDTLIIVIENESELEALWHWCNCATSASLISYCSIFSQRETLLRNIKHIKDTIYYTIRNKES